MDFILAAGGGSVIDCCKVISVQAMTEEDIWNMEYQTGKFPSAGIPMGAVVTASGTGAEMNAASYKTFLITIPEDLDYTGIFDDIFMRYTSAHELVHVRTANMGSMFRLTYHITLRDPAEEKEMIDQIRCRNGNLEIAVSSQETGTAEL